MKFTLPAGTFPPLELSPEEVDAITQTAQRMVDETMSEFDDMIANSRQLPKKRWKLVKERGHLAVYRTRKIYNYASGPGAVGASSSSWTPQVPHLLTASMYQKHERARKRAATIGEETVNSMTRWSEADSELLLESCSSQSDAALYDDRIDSAMHLESALEASKPPRTPVVVVTGFYPGTVEDVALGSLADTDALWRLRSSYLDDERDDCKILATLQRPSKYDPFRFLGVKWASKQFAAFTAQRDLLYIESSGVLRDPATGAINVAYNLMHSIELPRVPELRQFDIIRVKLSICHLTRRHDAGTVELYCRGFSAPGGDMLGSISTAVYADALLHSSEVIACAYAKKIMWLTQQRRAAGGARVKQSVPTATHCHSCTKSFRGLSGALRSSVVCQCCRSVVCGKCSVRMKLTVDVTLNKVTRRDVPFCLRCVLHAKKLSALAVAVASVPDGNWSLTGSHVRQPQQRWR